MYGWRRNARRTNRQSSLSFLLPNRPVLISPPHLLYRPALTGMVVETLPYPESLEDRLHALEDYSERTFKPVDSVLQEVVERAHAHNMPDIHVGNMDGLTLEVIIRMAGYKKASTVR
ncbi:Phosphoribosylamine--glycine ligase [Frankliniella fusca]|uniref:Phosphoribosylamine--glycine ligase n=1 Tax=Frankliniella fusca TaxID=407009 RepID=A0AAE1LEV0_9NEOP|nr:Phosphoribosylamine--glycine ligase [Frankliniella fusca]